MSRDYRPETYDPTRQNPYPYPFRFDEARALQRITLRRIAELTRKVQDAEARSNARQSTLREDRAELAALEAVRDTLRDTLPWDKGHA